MLSIYKQTFGEMTYMSWSIHSTQKALFVPSTLPVGTDGNKQNILLRWVPEAYVDGMEATKSYLEGSLKKIRQRESHGMQKTKDKNKIRSIIASSSS